MTYLKIKNALYSLVRTSNMTWLYSVKTANKVCDGRYRSRLYVWFLYRNNHVNVYVYLRLDSLDASSDQEFEIIKGNLSEIDISNQNSKLVISTDKQQNPKDNAL